MVSNALLVSRDSEVLMILLAVLRELRIETEITTEVERTFALLRDRKFAAIIVDYDLEGAEAVLKDLDLYPSNRTAVAFVLVPQGDLRSGSPPRAKFIMTKPISAEQARRALRASSSLLVSEYRRYFRCALAAPIHLAGTNREFNAITTNISMGGLAFKTLQRVELAEKFKLELALPEAGLIQADGEVVWADTQGRAGVHFVDLPDEAKKRLQSWLNSKMNEAELTH